MTRSCLCTSFRSYIDVPDSLSVESFLYNKLIVRATRADTPKHSTSAKHYHRSTGLERLYRAMFRFNNNKKVLCNCTTHYFLCNHTTLGETPYRCRCDDTNLKAKFVVGICDTCKIPHQRKNRKVRNVDSKNSFIETETKFIISETR